MLGERLWGGALLALDMTRHAMRHFFAAGLRKAHYQLTPGAIGCYLAHQSALEMAAGQSEPYALLFEDDMTFPENASKDLEHHLKCSSMVNWDMLLMTHLWTFTSQPMHQDPGCQLEQLRHWWGTQAYVVTPQSAAKLLGLLRAQRITQHIDSQLSCFAEKHGLTVLSRPCREDCDHMPWVPAAYGYSTIYAGVEETADNPAPLAPKC